LIVRSIRPVPHENESEIMSRIIQLVLATTSLVTGVLALRMRWQFDRSMRTAFALTAEDLP
jgi:hypothetical protein